MRGWAGQLPGAGAAPHLPAGILSPYSDGERGHCHRRFRQSPTLNRRRDRNCPFLPVPIRGEMPGRAMRGGADIRWTFASHSLET
ncbi:hypothetical protein FJ872_23535 [Mesorhizobium sp. B2-5-9]|nr:hypothetical protein FJ872_23535 [Mesorhizobium sp. B2-5-9]